MPNEQIERIIVTVDDQHLPEIQAVCIALQAAGMKVDSILAGSGIITGAVYPSSLENLKQISGVADVETDQDMQAL